MVGELTDIIKCFSILSMLLLLGTFLWAKIKVFQKLFLPASVIGGALGLILGPEISGDTLNAVFSPKTLSVCSALPGILNLCIVSGIPLTLGENMLSESKTGKNLNALKTWTIIVITFFVQILIGLTVQFVFKNQLNLYPTFGYELISGYNGGHSTAGVLGKLLQELGEPYWENAQGVATTTAAFGLVGGMLIGIAYINVMARLNKTACLKPQNSCCDPSCIGIRPKTEKTFSCKETTYASSIDSLSLHLSILLLCIGLAYIAKKAIDSFGVPFFKEFPVITYCIFVMFAVAWGPKKLRLDYLIDEKTIKKIGNTCV